MDDPQVTSPFTPPFDMASCQEPVLVTGPRAASSAAKVVETTAESMGLARSAVLNVLRVVLSKLNEILRRFPAG